MKKRLLNLLLVLLMVACVLPMAVSATTTQGQCAMTDHQWKDGKCNIGTCGYECDHKVNGESAWEDKGYREDSEPTCTDAGLSVLECSICHYKTTREAPAKGHSYGDEVVVKAPTCTASGTSRFTCTVCNSTKLTYPAAKGHTPVDEPKVDPTCSSVGTTAGQKCDDCNVVLSGMEEIPMIPHTRGSMVEYTKRATCQETGSAKYACTECDGFVVLELPKLNCNIETLPAVDPTCYAIGLTEGKKCDSCNNGADCAYCATVVKGQTEVQKVDHEMEIIRVDTAPTCTTAGEGRYDCKNCGYAYDGTIESTGHTPEEIPAQAATCAKPAMSAGVRCSVCEIVLTAPVASGNKLPHEMEVIRVDTAPTCTDTGYGRYDCKNCGYAYDGVIDALGHDMQAVEVIREATCTLTSCTKYCCANEGCGQTTYLEEAALGHTEKTVDAVESTCTTTGLTEGTVCSVCNTVLVEQTEVPLANHTWVDAPAENATCIAPGLTAGRKCSVCNAVLVAQEETPLAEHNYVNNRCTVCREYDPAHEHEGSGRVTTAATCTSAGVMTYTCNGCDHTWTEPIAMTSHNYVSGECTVCHNPDPNHVHSYTQTGYTAPGCTAKGQIIQVCSVCRNETKTDIDPLGHSYVNGVCTRCDEPNPAEVCNHTNTYTETVDATCTRDGYEKEICVCDHVVSTRVLEATGHSYVNGVCSVCKHKDSNRVTNDYQDVFMLEEN